MFGQQTHCLQHPELNEVAGSITEAVFSENGLTAAMRDSRFPDTRLMAAGEALIGCLQVMQKSERASCVSTEAEAGRRGSAKSAARPVNGEKAFSCLGNSEEMTVVAEGDRSEILRRNARLYSQTPRPFGGFGALHRHRLAPPLVQKVSQFEPMAVQLHCVIEKASVIEEKMSFSLYAV
ncbi:hypothetical protein DPX16_23797 [Anabarilius grahami]|uniref:Uncharacterized protein n=1 Tax=Anabarilius grahami TaxID=495550 RepID=A0A3N0YMD7_ANAGA|nr:hypothetical protein DPX16_23797 [Anabarilius grahami]